VCVGDIEATLPIYTGRWPAVNGLAFSARIIGIPQTDENTNTPSDTVSGLKAAWQSGAL